jgi:hypothetical protein
MLGIAGPIPIVKAYDRGYTKVRQYTGDRTR